MKLNKSSINKLVIQFGCNCNSCSHAASQKDTKVENNKVKG